MHCSTALVSFDNVIAKKYENPFTMYLGALEVQTYLKTKGVNVQRQRCRDILGRVDPLGTATRWSCTIQRRQYSVPTANSVWHVDTHHSLIRLVLIIMIITVASE